jgi:inorganic pyrophosphatase
MRLEAIKIGTSPPNDINVVVEVPVSGEPIKYEMDKTAGTLVWIAFCTHPCGIQGTAGLCRIRSHPMAIRLMCSSPTLVPGAVVNVRPIGVLKMEDDGGMDENAVPTSKLSKHYESVRTYADLPQISLGEIQHFFQHYKDLEPGKWVKLSGWGDVEEAKGFIIDAIERAASLALGSKSQSLVT